MRHSILDEAAVPDAQATATPVRPSQASGRSSGTPAQARCKETSDSSSQTTTRKRKPNGHLDTMAESLVRSAEIKAESLRVMHSLSLEAAKREFDLKFQLQQQQHEQLMATNRERTLLLEIQLEKIKLKRNARKRAKLPTVVSPDGDSQSDSSLSSSITVPIE